MTQLRESGEDGIVEEITQVASNAVDSRGWTDADWLRYVREEKAFASSALVGTASALSVR